MSPDAAELMHAGETAENCPVIDHHMTGQRGIVGEGYLVADLAIVRDMHVGHDPVVVANRGHAAILHRAQVKGAKLANGVAVADLQTGRFAGIFLVLRHFTQRAELEDAVVAPDTGMAPDHAMRSDDRVVTNLDVRTDDRIGADLDIGADFGARIDQGSRVDHVRDPAWRTSGGPRPPVGHRHGPRP